MQKFPNNRNFASAMKQIKTAKASSAQNQSSNYYPEYSYGQKIIETDNYSNNKNMKAISNRIKVNNKEPIQIRRINGPVSLKIDRKDGILQVSNKPIKKISIKRAGIEESSKEPEIAQKELNIKLNKQNIAPVVLKEVQKQNYSYATVLVENLSPKIDKQYLRDLIKKEETSITDIQKFNDVYYVYFKYKDSALRAAEQLDGRELYGFKVKALVQIEEGRQENVNNERNNDKHINNQKDNNNNNNTKQYKDSYKSKMYSDQMYEDKMYSDKIHESKMYSDKIHEKQQQYQEKKNYDSYQGKMYCDSIDNRWTVAKDGNGTNTGTIHDRLKIRKF